MRDIIKNKYDIVFDANNIGGHDLSNGIMAAIRKDFGNIGDTDSYKLSHSPQYRPGTTKMMSYIESRGGVYDKVVFAGLQLIMLEYFTQQVTHKMIDNMKAFAAGHGEPFDEECWRKVVNVYDGWIPIKIRAVKEGAIIPVKNVLATVETTTDDPDVFHLVSYFETKILRLWSATTVATISYHVRETIMMGLNITCDNPEEQIWHRLNDFGSRGTTSEMSSAFSGIGHLFSFMGTDNIPSVLAARYGYQCGIAGHSISASEHSTTCSWTKDLEKEFMKNMITTFGPNGIFAAVSDTYDIENCVKNIWGDPEIKQMIIDSGAIVVVRPDSNDPVRMPIQVVEWLDEIYGHTTNKKGYKVLNNVRVIQGDGLDPQTIEEIVKELIRLEWSVENVAYGMGAGLLQKNDRDTQKFAMKGCAYYTNGEWVNAYKDPSVVEFKQDRDGEWHGETIKDKSFKRSKAGRLTLVSKDGEFRTINIDSELQDHLDSGWTEELEDVFDCGNILRVQSLDDIRESLFKNEKVIKAENVEVA